MFIPAFLDISPCAERRYIWHFFGAVNMQKYCHGPVIAPEDYFAPPSSMVTPDTEHAWSRNCFANQNLPRDEDLNKVAKYPIPHQLLSKLIGEFGSKSDAAVAVYAQRIPALEEWFCKTLEDLQTNSAEEIEALVLVVDIPSFSCVCRSQKIPVLYYEFGGFREPSYSNVAYYSLDGVHLHLKLKHLYAEFIQQIDQLEPWEIFTPKEILALYLVPEKLKLLRYYDSVPSYSAGVLAEITAFAPTQSISRKSTLDLLDIAIRNFARDAILVRDHPGDPLRPSFCNLGVALDNSPSAAEFILKCSKIISRTSNSIVEALLWGRSVYTIDPEPYGFVCLPSLEGDAPQTIDIRFLNFMAFAFYFPMEFTYDIAYMRWRLTKPSWIEIYRKNLDYCLTVHGVPKEKLHQPGEERLCRILASRQVRSENAQTLLSQLREWKEKERALQAELDDPATADVVKLQTVREIIRRLQTATGLDTTLPHLTVTPEFKPQTEFWAESTLFWDTGNGFSQEESCTAKLTCRNSVFDVLFIIPDCIGDSIQALRWDPLEGQTVAVTPNQTADGQLFPMNASFSENGTDYFCTKDPMYRVTMSGYPRCIKLSGFIRILSQSEVEWVFCKELEHKNTFLQQIRSLQEQLRTTCKQLELIGNEFESPTVEL